MAADVTASTLSLAEITKYSRRLLEFAVPKMVLSQFAQKPDTLSSGNKDVIFSAFIPIPRSTTPTNITSGANTLTSSKKTYLRQHKVSPKEYAGTESFDLFDVKRMFVNYVQGASKLYGDWMGQYINYLLTQVASVGSLHVRADWDTNYMKRVACTSTGTTTTAISTSLTEADDYWNGAYVTWLSGVNKGKTWQVTDFVASTDTLTLDSDSQAVATADTDKFSICSPAGLTDGDKMNVEAVTKSVAILEKLNAMKWGNEYVGYIDAFSKHNFLTSIIPVAQYTQLGIEKIFKYELGITLGVRWVTSPEAYRETVAGAESRDAGAVYNVLIIGQDAFGQLDIKIGANEPELIVKTPGPQTTSDPANQVGTLAVKCAHAPTMLNSLACISIMCVPDVPLDISE